MPAKPPKAGRASRAVALVWSGNAENRIPVVIAALIVLGIYAVLPSDVQFFPPWLIPVMGLLILLPLVLYNPARLNREATWSRWISILFALKLATVNQVFVVVIILRLIDGQAEGPSVLLTALEVWIANAIAFAFIYWELDRGGPVARRIEGLKDDARQDFRFPHQASPAEFPGWQPSFLDYAYLSITNMMAFSPADALPLTVRAKAIMAYQALTAFVLLALVISRAVGILT